MKFLLKINLQIRSIKVVHISYIPRFTYYKSLLLPDYTSYCINNVSILDIVSSFICAITVAKYQMYLLNYLFVFKFYYYLCLQLIGSKNKFKEQD